MKRIILPISLFLIWLSLTIFITSITLAQSPGNTPKDSSDARSRPQQKKQAPKDKTSISEDEDSMSGIVEWQVVLRDDNGNLELPARYRTWWYLRLDGCNPNRESKLHIVGDGFQGGTIVLPVYSYDRKTWHRLRPENIERGAEEKGLYNYTVKKRFEASTVWLARYYPYPFSRLRKFLESKKESPYLKVEEIGKSAHGRPMLMATITDPNVPDENKKRVWIHARTHPSETPSSYIVEGLIEYLLSDCNINCKEADLSKLIFNIVPVLNVDGVVEGNARVTPDSSYDLERMWFREKDDPMRLRDTCPPEVKAVHSTISKLFKKGPDFFIALNLHSKNAPPDWMPFIYTNFHRKNKEYGAEGDTMFVRQLAFVKILNDLYPCGDSLRLRPSFERQVPMEKKVFPEVWWWMNFKDRVMAATFELTTGFDGCYEEWATREDHKKLGESLAKAVRKFYDYYVVKVWDRYDTPETDIEKLLNFYMGNRAKK